MSSKQTPLPPEWSVQFSKSQKREYYFNKKTGAKYWKDPSLPFGWSHDFEQYSSKKIYFHILDIKKTTTYECPKQNKRPREDDDDDDKQEPPSSKPPPPITKSKSRVCDILNNPPPSTTTTTVDDASTTASFYDQLKRNNVSEREDSLLYHLRSFNNWIKSVLIQKFSNTTTSSNEDLTILDLACGKGGDVLKWFRQSRRIKSYVGIDIARQSLVDAVDRIKNKTNISRVVEFAQADLGSIEIFSDPMPHYRNGVWNEKSYKVLAPNSINMVSMQFALHYMFGTQDRARRFFKAVSSVLVPSGLFIATTVDCNTVVRELYKNLKTEEVEFKDEEDRLACRIGFSKESYNRIVKRSEEEVPPPYGLRYTFELKDSTDDDGHAVNAPEYLIPNTILKDLAREFDLEIVLQENFHTFAADSMKDRKYASLSERMNVTDIFGGISDIEWKIAGLYQVLAFKKKAV